MGKKYLDIKENSLESSVYNILHGIQETVKKEKLDPVGKEDGDIDNDGDKDASDKYLAKRRKTISKAIKKDKKEGNAFGMALKSAKDNGEKTFVVSGKTYKVEGLEDSPNTANSQHLCAKNVVHENWGNGTPINGQHAEPDAEGDIAWYDVMFEHGIEKGVSINELKVTKAESHHHSEKKKKKMDEKVEYVEYKFKNKNDAMAAKKMLDAVQMMNFEINDDNISGGELMVDSGSRDMTKYHKEVMKKFKPKVMTQEKVDIDELMPATKHVAKSKKNPDMFCVFDKDGNEVKLFKDKKDAEEYAIKNHDALNEKADLDEASARGDAKRSMSRDRDLSRKGSSLDKDDFATDDDVKAASKNIMMQLRKAANLRGTFAVEFGDKKKVKVDPKVAQAAASKYNSLRRPADKEKFQMQIAKSYKDMLGAIKEAVSPAQQAAIAISKKERGEKPKKESKFDTINKQLKGEK